MCLQDLIVNVDTLRDSDQAPDRREVTEQLAGSICSRQTSILKALPGAGVMLQAESCAHSQEEAEGDHPLNTDQNSRWKEYFRVRPTSGRPRLCRTTDVAEHTTLTS